jgi:hypothetical protein
MLLPAEPSSALARAPERLEIPSPKPQPDPGQLPPPGSIWFATDFAEKNSHLLAGRASHFELTPQIVMTARFVRDASSRIQMFVTGPDLQTTLVQVFDLPPATNVVSSTLTGLAMVGSYSVSFLDADNETLAVGAFVVDSPAPTSGDTSVAR